MARNRRTVSVTDFDSVLRNILGEYREEVAEECSEIAQKVAKTAAKELKVSSPRLRGAYARDWAAKKGGRNGLDTGYIVYNRKHYQVAHLLEKGHVSKNQYGVTTKGFVSAKVHIKPVEKSANDDYYRKVKGSIGR